MQARLVLGLLARADVAHDGDGAFVAPGTALQRTGAHLGHEGRAVGPTQLHLVALAAARSARVHPFFGDSHELGIDEVVGRAS